MTQDSKPVAKPRAIRADAQYNQQRIVAAAKTRFASDGPNAAMDAIARDAGVAVGTLYHHFGSKEGLLEHVIHQHFQVIKDFLSTLQASSDPWVAVEQIVRRLAEHQINDRAFKAMVHQHSHLIETKILAKRGIGPAMQTVINRAQAAGVVRSDLQADDLPALLAGMPIDEAQAEDRERYLLIVLQGIKSEND